MSPVVLSGTCQCDFSRPAHSMTAGRSRRSGRRAQLLLEVQARYVAGGIPMSLGVAEVEIDGDVAIHARMGVGARESKSADGGMAQPHSCPPGPIGKHADRASSRLFSAPYVLAPLATTRSAEPSSALCVTSPVIQAEATLTIAKTPLSSQSPASFRPLSGRGANSDRYLDRRRSATRCLRRHALATRNTAKATTINQALRMICPGRTRSLSKSR